MARGARYTFNATTLSDIKSDGPACGSAALSSGAARFNALLPGQ